MHLALIWGKLLCEDQIQVLQPAQLLEQKILSPSGVLPKAMSSSASTRVSIQKLKPHEICILSLVFKYLLVIASGYEEHICFQK